MKLLIETTHCSDLQGDRALGNYWEREFCKLAGQHGKLFTPHQIGRKTSAAAYRFLNGWHPLTLPDITVWTSPSEHHEIKHKRPTESGSFGLEDYRFRALKWFRDETEQRVYYTIHRWDRSGDRADKTSRSADWVTAEVSTLWQATLDGTAKTARFPSYVAGEKKTVDGWFWPASLWMPLLSIWSEAA